MLQHIIPSKARREILELFYTHVGEAYHLRRVSREVSQEINAVKRELDILEDAKVLLKEKRLNKSIYTINTNYIYFDEFLRIFTKRSHLVKQILKNKTRLGKIYFCALSLKYTLHEKIPDSEVYLLFVGVVVAQEVQKIIQAIESEFPYEINYTIMAKDEFQFRKRQNDPFIWSFLKEPKVMIYGTENGLMA